MPGAKEWIFTGSILLQAQDSELVELSNHKSSNYKKDGWVAAGEEGMEDLKNFSK